MDTLYARWIGVPVAVLVCLGIIAGAFLLNIFLGFVALIFVGSVAEIWIAGTYAQKPAIRDTYKAP